MFCIASVARARNSGVRPAGIAPPAGEEAALELAPLPIRAATSCCTLFLSEDASSPLFRISLRMLFASLCELTWPSLSSVSLSLSGLAIPENSFFKVFNFFCPLRICVNSPKDPPALVTLGPGAVLSHGGGTRE